MAWNPFGVMLEVSATAGTATRTSATQFTVPINVAWETYYSGAKTNYGMEASSGGKTVVLNKSGNSSSGSSGTLTGTTFSISGNSKQTKTITVTFRNFNNDNNKSETTIISLSVSVPAWTSYKVTYNANGGTGTPSAQTKYKDQNLTLSSTKPTKPGYLFLGWSTSSTATTATYSAGQTIAANVLNTSNTTLYAVWKANTYTVSYDANDGENAPGEQTKNYDEDLTLSKNIPTRANYTFKGWGTSAGATTVSYAPGASYTKNEAVTLYAIWELAYTKPRIKNFSITRCDESGVSSKEGKYAFINFDWECDLQVETILLTWSATTSSAGDTIDLIDSSEGSKFSGNVSKIIGGSFSSMASYIIEVAVADSNGSTPKSRTLNSLAFTIHAKEGGNGIAFGKVSELDNTAEFEFDAKFNKPVYGKVLGMDKIPAIGVGESFNDYLEPGCYAVYKNSDANNIWNMPVPRAGRLEVWAATGEGVRPEEQYSYLKQRFIPYNCENAIWERDITRSASNEWTFYDWFRSTLTPIVSEKVYNKSAVTVGLTANIASLTSGSYTKVAFDKSVSSMGNKLSLSNNSILIGSDVSFVKVNAQILLKVLAQGSKHFKISKVSNETTTHYAWICQEVDQIKNSAGDLLPTGVEFNLMPIIIPVTEGDYITCMYYTNNSTDYIVSGSSANGYQTYLTVEML